MEHKAQEAEPFTPPKVLQRLTSADRPHPLRIGGLFRCCVATYNVYAPPASKTSDGDKLPCPGCGSGLVAINRVWEWDATRKSTR